MLTFIQLLFIFYLCSEELEDEEEDEEDEEEDEYEFIPITKI
jgi:hypothetical protein